MLSSGSAGKGGGGGTPPKKRFTVRKGVNSPSSKKVKLVLFMYHRTNCNLYSLMGCIVQHLLRLSRVGVSHAMMLVVAAVSIFGLRTRDSQRGPCSALRLVQRLGMLRKDFSGIGTVNIGGWLLQQWLAMFRTRVVRFWRRTSLTQWWRRLSAQAEAPRATTSNRQFKASHVRARKF